MPTKKIRLHQFLSRTGAFATKSEVEKAIKHREITLNGTIITNPEFQFKEKGSKVEWKKKLLHAVVGNTYLLFNKPSGYLCSQLTIEDKKRGKKSVFELLEKQGIEKSILRTLFCVGRLDENSEGLLILTSDGELGKKITDPSSKIPKIYDVIPRSPLTMDQIESIQNGITIDLEENGVHTPYKTKPAQLEPISEHHYRITITEGKKREIRRIFHSLGNNVIRLQRIGIGSIKLAKLKLKPGQLQITTLEFLKQHI